MIAHAERALARGSALAGLAGDALGCVLGGLPGSRLVIVDGADAAQRLIGAIRFFHPHPERVALFPADDTRPYDGFSPAPEIPIGRMAVLDRVERGEEIVVVAPIQALARRIPDRATRERGTRRVSASDQIDRDELVRFLVESGYSSVGRVEAPATLAVRGDVVDVWPAGMSHPVRIDWYDDLVEEVRKLDPSSQRATIKLRGATTLLPAREERVDEAALDRLPVELARHVTAQKRGQQLRRRVWEELRAGIRFAGLEAWLPALVPTETPLDALVRLPRMAVHPDQLSLAVRDGARLAEERWAALDEDERPLVPPAERHVPADALVQAIRAAQSILEVPSADAVDLGCRSVDGFVVRGAELGPVVERLAGLAKDDARVAIVADDGKRAENIREMFEGRGLHLVGRADPRHIEAGEVALVVGDLRRGFIAKDHGIAFVPVAALFGERRHAPKTEANHAFFDSAVGHVNDLREGDPVVHRLHGIGLYRGLVRVPVMVDSGKGGMPWVDGDSNLANVLQDFVRVEFRGGDLLLLPVTRLEQLSRYAAATDGAVPQLDKLGGITWAARRAKVRDSVLAMASDLLDLYSKRGLATRPAYVPPGPLYRTFEARFPYDETVDQAAAIEAVLADLEKEVPMDRLVCGDVGYGKTEVAMRAAARAVENGTQVAVLCPTTVLAYQHFERFRERFEGLPVVVEMLTRFRTAAQERDILAALKAGKIDVIVGTTRLLGRGVRYAKLGLAVVDEEHRFGVSQKDKLKKLRSDVDVLSMSATPIPRTLQMGLSGLREMSIMATPPRDRLAVRTTIAKWDRRRISEAIRLEIERKGQVFFVHNRIEDIHELAEQLQTFVPEARFTVAHGQMSAESLEDALVDFIERRADVLVSSAIVENGVDLPNVNTMIVNRADRFGLAQLYQLRGRVGRGAARGHCMLLVPDDEATDKPSGKVDRGSQKLTADAKKRLRTLVDNTELGSGFRIAMADLEMRGAGNLLGDAQSGNIDAIGYEAWLEVLGEAISDARGVHDQKRIDPEVEVAVAAFIPDALIPDIPERLARYRELSSCVAEYEVDGWLSALEDRFGTDLPPEVHDLAGLARTRVLCRDLGIVRCAWLKVRVVLELHPKSRIPKPTVDALVTASPKRWSVKDRPEGRLLEVRFLPEEADRPFRFLRWVFAQLGA